MPFSQGGTCVPDFEVRCQRLHVPHRYAPVGHLSPSAERFLVMARMAMVAAVRVGYGIFEQGDMSNVLDSSHSARLFVPGAVVLAL